jgi:hypothetical protein
MCSTNELEEINVKFFWEGTASENQAQVEEYNLN